MKRFYLLASILLLAHAGCSDDDKDNADGGLDGGVQFDASTGDTSGGACSDGDPDTECATGTGDTGDDPACSDGDLGSACPDTPADSGGDGDGATGGDGDGVVGGDGDSNGDGDSTPVVTDGPTGVPPGDWVVPDELKLCGDRACQCADGVDNDNDGTADGFDSECTGPNDDDEGSFATGISGDNMDPKWQDCFFDGNSGAGDDGCRYHTDCLTGDLPQDHNSCTVTQECVDFCMKRTPNGCDCFGCCSITESNGDVVNVVISPDCDADDLGACTSCQPTEGLCNNECGECELCPGKQVEDLPDHCFPPPGGDGDGDAPGGDGDGDAPGGDGDGPFVCEGGQDTCVDNSTCEFGYYCIFGCCVLSGPG